MNKKPLLSLTIKEAVDFLIVMTVIGHLMTLYAIRPGEPLAAMGIDC